jgi:hypothetical protein
LPEKEINKMSFLMSFLKESTGLVHIFIDNSNIEILEKLKNIFKDQIMDGRQMDDNSGRSQASPSKWKINTYKLGYIMLF